MINDNQWSSTDYYIWKILLDKSGIWQWMQMKIWMFAADYVKMMIAPLITFIVWVIQLFKASYKILKVENFKWRNIILYSL